MLITGIINHGIVEEHDLPAQMHVGQTTLATWSLETGSSGGFARFQVQFPKGVVAEALEDSGASFTFENGRGKFIWVDTAPGETIFLKMRLTATSEFEGGTITQWFSYISEGTRKDVEFEPHHVSLEILGEEVDSTLASPDGFSIIRSWRADGPDVGKMTLSISGHEPGQFLKIEDVLLGQCQAEPFEDGEASLRDVFDQSILFVWQQAPEAPFQVSYRVMGDTEICSSTILGKASTVSQGAAVELAIEALEPALDDTAATVPAEAAPQPNNGSHLSQQDAPTNPQGPESSQPDIRFKVQILASHQRVPASHFVQRYQFNKALMIVEHEEWIKYMTGSFTQYEAARNERVQIRANHDLPGPFVTAYSGESRITVQEALLTTQQNWIP
ncbi:hypothetical protein OAF30_05040 [Flavobacteriales bacterium]|nr:hypothetical protein [Flavobacteriales bacterium]